MKYRDAILQARTEGKVAKRADSSVQYAYRSERSLVQFRAGTAFSGLNLTPEDMEAEDWEVSDPEDAPFEIQTYEPLPEPATEATVSLDGGDAETATPETADFAQAEDEATGVGEESY